MTWLLTAWAGFRNLDPETRRWIGIAALVAVGFVAVWWLRSDAASDARRDLENEANKRRIENINDAKETEREIENLDDDDFGTAIDGLPRHDPTD